MGSRVTESAAVVVEGEGVDVAGLLVENPWIREVETVQVDSVVEDVEKNVVRAIGSSIVVVVVVVRLVRGVRVVVVGWHVHWRPDPWQTGLICQCLQKEEWLTFAMQNSWP